MPYAKTTALKKIVKLEKRIRVIAGGTSAGKTIGVLQYLIALCQTDKKPTLTSVVSESFPHLRRGAMRDFLNIMQEHGYFNDERWSKTDFIYTFESGSKLEFFSADQPSKVRGPRRDRLFINEVNNVPGEAWEQLILRTKEFAFVDFNPVNDFYIYEEYGITDDPIGVVDPDTDFLILTYKDNEALDKAIVKEIERRAELNKNFKRVYAQGLRGEMEGLVYTGWNIIDEVPHEAELKRRGMDFGYTNDPTAIVGIYHYNGGYILDEEVYQTSMRNSQIAETLKNLTQPSTLVIADSSEPKSIDEIRLAGVNILGVEKKGVNSKSFVKSSIDYVQDQRISITKRSLNLIKEYRNYMWATDKEGKTLNEPIDGNDHALDAIRYGLWGMRPIKRETQTSSGNLTGLWSRR